MSDHKQPFSQKLFNPNLRMKKYHIIFFEIQPTVFQSPPPPPTRECEGVQIDHTNETRDLFVKRLLK